MSRPILQVSSSRDTGKERVDGAERPSTLNQVWSCRLTAASIPLSVNEVSVDPLRGTTPPPWSRIAALTRLPRRLPRIERGCLAVLLHDIGSVVAKAAEPLWTVRACIAQQERVGILPLLPPSLLGLFSFYLRL